MRPQLFYQFPILKYLSVLNVLFLYFTETPFVPLLPKGYIVYFLCIVPYFSAYSWAFYHQK